MEHFSPKIVEAVETVKTSPSVQRAFDYVKDHLEETIRDQKELVLIGAFFYFSTNSRQSP